ncbi:hypothetical protein [Streptomyces kronopolitis]|uniref:hypothetical protein n=1 Tax=Streptomyces kronopolitis TaxID=1612435 RepID=UPI003D97C521
MRTTLRRTIAAALGFGQHAARSIASHVFRLLVDLYRAIDVDAAVESATARRTAPSPPGSSSRPS